MKSFWLDTTRLTDGELADLLHELNNELETRRRTPNPGQSWLQHQLESAQLTVRSWSTSHQRAMRNSI